MALPLQPGLVPTEVAFLCEMEMVTIVPRQRLESIPLLSGKTPALRPPHRAQVPFWLALLLKKQRRANIVSPPWLHADSLQDILNQETNINQKGFSPHPPPPMRSDGRGGSRPFGQSSSELKPGETVLSPPFLPSCTQNAPSGYLPYHWLEFSETLLAHAADDIPNAAEVRALLRDLQEVRAAKMRGSTKEVNGEGGFLALPGAGAMELAESRGFFLGVVDGVRKLGTSAEASRREEEEEEEERRNGRRDDDGDEEMEF
ncbi:GINS complex, PSF2 component [Hypoxylon fragiforme]|uniref:GINS complex, PSF2 component n=1 Tax=Hypoxylon fragiforme TaxID=63214 RepID=UPI0020C61E72|nr:GINS complex, PSF2 component [Hypoxylon fragiforme]KAI2607465.1 GINS complex, PSF2 component [Hypoxylon fragiforme]